MNGWRPSAGNRANLIDLLEAIDTDDIGVRLLDGSYTNDDNDEFLNATNSAAIASEQMTNNAVAEWDWTADDVVFSSIPDGDIVEALVVYIDTGSAATSRIVGFVDRKADTTGMFVETNGGDITIHWPQGIVAKL
jgi:hypothetical protein